jgi:hypothetical protein
MFLSNGTLYLKIIKILKDDKEINSQYYYVLV